ncbi:MAG: hypothetical protein ABEJ68_03790 [Halobacteriaceae archaeon]
MPQRSQINLRVDTETKERWEDYVEEDPNIENLSFLIRFAVNQHIEDDGTSGDGGLSKDDLRDVLESRDEEYADVQRRLKRIEKEIGDIHDAVEGVEKEVNAPDPSGIENEAFGALPESSHEAMTADELAEKLNWVNIPNINTQGVLNQLSATSRVRTIVGEDGETRYWKEADV